MQWKTTGAGSKVNSSKLACRGDTLADRAELGGTQATQPTFATTRMPTAGGDGRLAIGVEAYAA